jgi:hypothetical protein
LRRVRFGLLLLIAGILARTAAIAAKLEFWPLPAAPFVSLLAMLPVTAALFLVTSRPGQEHLSDLQHRWATRFWAVALLAPAIMGLAPFGPVWAIARILFALSLTPLAWSFRGYLRGLAGTAVPAERTACATAAACCYTLYAVMVTFEMLAYLSGGETNEGSLAFSAHILSYPVAFVGSTFAIFALFAMLRLLRREERAGDTDPAVS